MSQCLPVQDENEEEEDLLDKVGGVLTAVLKVYQDNAMPMIDTLMPQIGGLLDPQRSAGERRIGICIIDDLLEHSAAGRICPIFNKFVVSVRSGLHQRCDMSNKCEGNSLETFFGKDFALCTSEPLSETERETVCLFEDRNLGRLSESQPSSILKLEISS